MFESNGGYVWMTRKFVTSFLSKLIRKTFCSLHSNAFNFNRVILLLNQKLCQRLGWKSKRTKWDVLPLVLSAPDEDPQLFPIPEELVLRVKISHPRYV